MDDKPLVYTINSLRTKKLRGNTLLGNNTKDIYGPTIEANKKNILPEDLCTIIYTSGTTAFPKE
jgi:long-subunit acyl-CoA synthetase (AMP-forming)